MLKIDTQAVIDAYKKGQSMTSIAKAFGTYPATIKRLLEKTGTPLRHDSIKKGKLQVKNGEKLIEWAKTQGRPVTKAELAKVAGTKRLSPSYFIKYPELAKYIKIYEQQDIKAYTQKLYDWLQQNNIKYKPNDRTKLGVSVDALLLGEYSGLAIQIIEKSYYVSKKTHEAVISSKITKAREAGIDMITLTKDDLDKLDELKVSLDKLKRY